jgi:hypothetical protein
MNAFLDYLQDSKPKIMKFDFDSGLIMDIIDFIGRLGGSAGCFTNFTHVYLNSVRLY